MTADHATATFVAEQDTPERKSLLPGFPVLILAGCLLFNFFLCFLNTTGFPVSQSHMILSEIVLVTMAAVYGFYNLDHARYYWLMILIAQFVLLSMLSVLRDELLVKAFRDVMIMPVFTALGLAAASKVSLSKALLWLNVLVLGVACFEALAPDIFTNYFNIREYYLLKGFDILSFQYLEDDLFVSSMRGGERFFPFPIEIHRVSSIFLEPVSLGFYAFISGLYFIAMKNRLPRKQVFLALLLTASLIWLGDARMAFGSLILVLLFRPLFSRLDHRLTVFAFPGALLTGYFIIESGLFNLSGEGIGARTLWTFEGLANTGDRQFFGTSGYATEMVDSGFLYLLGIQGIWGFLLYWLPPIFFKNKLSKQARVYWFGASIFITFGLMISYAIFTIKTASLLWFSYGYVIARTERPHEKSLKRKTG